MYNYFRGKSTLPVEGSSQFSHYFLNQLMSHLCLKMNKYLQFKTFSVKSNEITMITNTIQENNNAIFNFFFLLCSVRLIISLKDSDGFN